MVGVGVEFSDGTGNSDDARYGPCVFLLCCVWCVVLLCCAMYHDAPFMLLDT